MFVISIVFPFMAVRTSPGPERAAADRVLARGDDGQRAQRQPELGDDAHAFDDRAATRHVALHVLHVEGGLDRDPAGVERDRLADEAEQDVALGRRRLVAHDDHARRVVAALGHARERAHSELRELVGAERLGRQVLVLVRDLTSTLGQLLGRERVRARVREVARAVRAVGDPRGPLRRLGDALVAADEDEPLERVIRLRARLPATRVVGAENQAVDDRTRLLVLGERVVEQPGDRAADPLRGACDGSRRGAHCVGVELVGWAEPDEDEPLGGLLGVQDGRPPGLRPNVLFFGDPGGTGDVAACGNSVGADRDREDVGLRKRICDFDSHSGRDAIRQGFLR